MLLIEEYFYTNGGPPEHARARKWRALRSYQRYECCYSSQSKTREADSLTLEWAHQCCLKEVPNIQRHATWKAYLQPRKAILDLAWVFPPDLLFSSLSVHWNTSQPVFDHAMIMLRLPCTAARLGYAGACRPLYRTGLLRRCREDLKNMLDLTMLLAWRRLLDISMSQLPMPLSSV